MRHSSVSMVRLPTSILNAHLSEDEVIYVVS
jgi:hypothetical protein